MPQSHLTSFEIVGHAHFSHHFLSGSTSRWRPCSCQFSYGRFKDQTFSVAPHADLAQLSLRAMQERHMRVRVSRRPTIKGAPQAAVFVSRTTPMGAAFWTIWRRARWWLDQWGDEPLLYAGSATANATASRRTASIWSPDALSLKRVVQLPRLERGTPRSTIWCSNQLSYSCMLLESGRNLIRGAYHFKPNCTPSQIKGG